MLNRDVKGLYKKSAKIEQKTKNVVGIDIDFNPPKSPDLILNQEGKFKSIENCVNEILIETGLKKNEKVMKELVFINTHPPRVGGGCFLRVMKKIQTKKTVYDGMIFQSKKELLTEKEVKKFLKINPTKFFISSHRITMEVPLNDKNVKVISFVRNPVNKIRSHYLWSRKVKADDEFPEAREMSFESFVDKFVRGKSNSRVETLLSSFMIKQENFFPKL